MSAKRLIALCNLAYVIIGLVLTVTGPLIPAVTSDYGIAYGDIGLAMAVAAAMYLPGVLLSGKLCKWIGPRPALATGLSIMAGGYLALWRATGWGGGLLGYSLGSGFGFGMAESALNVMVLKLAANRQGNALNKLHFFAAAGAVLGPLVASSLTVATGDWRQVFLTLALLMAGLAFLFFAARPPAEVAQSPAAATVSGRPAALATSPVMWLLAVAMLLYVGGEMGASQWMYAYIVTENGATPFAGTLLNSLFWVALGGGRLLAARVSERWGYEKLLFRGTAAAALAMIIAAWARQPGVIATALLLTGFFFAGTFPTLLALGDRRHPGQASAVTGFLMFATGLGTLTVPPAMGLVAGWTSVRGAMLRAAASMAGLAAATGMLRAPAPAGRAAQPGVARRTR